MNRIDKKIFVYSVIFLLGYISIISGATGYGGVDGLYDEFYSEPAVERPKDRSVLDFIASLDPIRECFKPGVYPDPITANNSAKAARLSCALIASFRNKKSFFLNKEEQVLLTKSIDELEKLSHLGDAWDHYIRPLHQVLVQILLGALSNDSYTSSDSYQHIMRYAYMRVCLYLRRYNSDDPELYGSHYFIYDEEAEKSDHRRAHEALLDFFKDKKSYRDIEPEQRFQFGADLMIDTKYKTCPTAYFLTHEPDPEPELSTPMQVITHGETGDVSGARFCEKRFGELVSELMSLIIKRTNSGCIPGVSSREGITWALRLLYNKKCDQDRSFSQLRARLFNTLLERKEFLLLHRVVSIELINRFQLFLAYEALCYWKGARAYPVFPEKDRHEHLELVLSIWENILDKKIRSQELSCSWQPFLPAISEHGFRIDYCVFRSGESEKVLLSIADELRAGRVFRKDREFYRRYLSLLYRYAQDKIKSTKQVSTYLEYMREMKGFLEGILCRAQDYFTPGIDPDIAQEIGDLKEKLNLLEHAYLKRVDKNIKYLSHKQKKSIRKIKRELKKFVARSRITEKQYEKFEKNIWKQNRPLTRKEAEFIKDLQYSDQYERVRGFSELRLDLEKELEAALDKGYEHYELSTQRAAQAAAQSENKKVEQISSQLVDTFVHDMLFGED